LPDASKRLGGFKVLKEMGEISLIYPKGNNRLLVELLQNLAERKINIPFLIFDNQEKTAGLHMAVEAGKTRETALIVNTFPGQQNPGNEKAAILSLFPHRNDPHIAAALLQAFGEKNIPFHALAHSQSAISAVLTESVLNKAAGALFEPFRFGAYRTPADWKLAQKGKEELHKEIVASYQEMKPRVYCLESQDNLTLFQVIFQRSYSGAMGLVFEDLAETGFYLSFLITSPPRIENEARLLFCIRQDLQTDLAASARRWLPDATLINSPSVALFSMNGPHFGDRYGLAYELFGALHQADVAVLALSCSIASMSGVVPSEQIHEAIHSIQGHFEVPAVMRKN
jgi:aspartokinase